MRGLTFRNSGFRISFMSRSPEDRETTSQTEVLTPDQKRYLLYSLGDPFGMGSETDLEWQRWQQELKNISSNPYARVRDEILRARKFLDGRVPDSDVIISIDKFLIELCDQHKMWKEAARNAVVSDINRGQLNSLGQLRLGLGDAVEGPFKYYAMSPYGLRLNPDQDSSYRARQEIVARVLGENYDRYGSDELETDLVRDEGISSVINGVIIKLHKRKGFDEVLEFGIAREEQLKAIQAPLVTLPEDFVSTSSVRARFTV